MKCPNCNKSFRGNFCPRCGAEAPAPVHPQNKKFKIIIAVMAVVICALSVIVYLTIGNGNSPNAPAVQSTVPPSKTAEPEPENYLLSLDIKKETVTTWGGEEITKNVMRADKEMVMKVSKEDFTQFFSKVVFGNGGIDIYLLFDDSTGICFDNGSQCFYGTFTPSLSVSEIKNVITVRGTSVTVRDCNANGAPYVMPSTESLSNDYPSGGYDINSSVDCVEAIARQAFGEQFGSCVYSEKEFSQPCLFININCDGYQYSEEQDNIEWSYYWGTCISIANYLQECSVHTGYNYNMYLQFYDNGECFYGYMIYNETLKEETRNKVVENYLSKQY